ncbi:MAG: FHA domain-containing protein [Anaerolineae bacterium]|nr:FHA domain-containing protein [Anaerolineae bacterium]
MPSKQRFLIQEGDHAGQVIDLREFPFTVGRSRDCSYVLDHTEISRLHAQITSDHENSFLEDVGSTNGTFVNGNRLEPGDSHRLRAGDRVSFAQICRWIFDDPATTAQIDPVDLPLLGLELDEAAARVTVGGVPLDPPLSPNQYILLALLVENAGRIVSREALCDRIWGPGQDVTDQTIDALVSRLRRRLLDADPGHDYIITRRGFGLMFENR